MTMLTATEALSQITGHRDAILAGNARIHPGQPISMETCCPGDVLPQGDLYVRLCKSNEKPPSDYIRITEPSADRLKLVPGPDAGSHHWLDSGDGVVMFMPPEWGTDLESTRGPWLRISKPRSIVHRGPSRHGDVAIPGDRLIEIGYQRVWDHERRAILRARD